VAPSEEQTAAEPGPVDGGEALAEVEFSSVDGAGPTVPADTPEAGLTDGLAAAVQGGAEEGVVEAGIAPIAPTEIPEPTAAADETGPDTAASAEAGVAPVAPPTEEAGDAPAPSEPILIEVWRLHRRQREGGHQARHQGRERPRGGEGAGRDARPQSRRPERRDRRPADPGQPQERRAEGHGEAGQQPASRQGRGPRRPDERRGPPREQRGAEARHNNGQEPRRREERRDKPPDPNSPFAKLLALKAQLEGRDGDKR
jgi:ATP-dependent RNA helicase SUPV3L1/SUV3